MFLASIRLLPLAAFLLAAPVFAATDEQAAATFQKLLDAQPGKNYEQFVANASDPLKAALSQTQFEAAADILNKRFKDGYDVKPLGELNQRGCQIYLYKIVCKDNGDDILATMALKDDKVAGILFH
jgi:hypothetical protein